MKFSIFILFLLSTVAQPCLSAVSKNKGLVFNEAIYLGQPETDKLSQHLSKNKFGDETFTLTFKCNKYKRNPNANDRTLNCIAAAVTPEVLSSESKK